MSSTLNVEALIESMATDLKSLIEKNHLDNPVMIGIHTGGVWVATKLHAMLDIQEPLGSMDISFYRDDFTRLGMNPQVKPSSLPFSVEDRHVILVDDVLYTGRTIRAAMNELFDYGRPASVNLAVLIDRDGRELPIAAAVAGQSITLEAENHIKLTGPTPLQLVSSRIQEDNG